MSEHTFIPPYGGYENLFSYQRARVVYRGTVHFVARWVPRISRTTDQMIQAARSGKQNIVEGSLASAVSKETEIKLTGVALASLGELLEDYRDFLYVRGIAEWPKDHAYVRRLSGLCRTPGAEYETFRKGIEHDDPAISANVLAGLTRVTIRLLDGQLKRLERDFVCDGGLRERMRRARLEYRDAAEAIARRRQEARAALPRDGAEGRQDPRDGMVKKRALDGSDQSDLSDAPVCRACGKPMRRRTAGKGPRAGRAFWGCSGYPDCRETMEISDRSDSFDTPASPTKP